MISFEITQISRGFFLEDLKDWHTGESPSVLVMPTHLLFGLFKTKPSRGHKMKNEDT